MLSHVRLPQQPCVSDVKNQRDITWGWTSSSTSAFNGQTSQMAATNGTNGGNGRHGMGGTNGSNGYTHHTPEPELCKIIPNALYLTFNAPQVDEYHRGIFLTHPLSICLPTPLSSGVLYHASYITDPSAQWILENRVVKDLSSSKSLVLLYRIATYVDDDMDSIAQHVEEVLKSVPLGKDARTKALGPCKGNPVLGGYDCVIWTADALDALIKVGLVNLGERTVDEIMDEARSLAGPPDARTMVGVHQDFRVIN